MDENTCLQYDNCFILLLSAASEGRVEIVWQALALAWGKTAFLPDLVTFHTEIETGVWACQGPHLTQEMIIHFNT